MGISNNILHHIENFTAQRDKELLAFSLLKSIRDILNPTQARILTVNGQDEPIMEIVINGNDACHYNYQNITISENIKASLDYISKWHLDELMEAHEEQYTAFHVLKQSRQLSQYLIVNLDNKPSRSESYIIKGMLSIYSNFSSLLAEAQTDELTGLMNRKTFDESIVKLYQSSALDEHNQNSANWIAIIDLDHFKTINDTYGHLYGDEVLIHVARALQQTFRQDDMLFRFGGEEFVILMRNLKREQCMELLERLQHQVSKIAMSTIDDITVSIGVCEFKNDIFHITLMDQADQALYHSKQNGRNRVTFYDNIVEAGLAQDKVVQGGTVDFF
ncbi:GGDEF domain-containing protein [Marinomonas ostreistagni]|uniref:GGDEF domain-containing protein n=1 Tax=Marinomonas ostreistagni TaxID=359209 RepID=UPI0019512CCD|nr:GGDEF domain-containing protein [Marinomonas ostreistagni]MBM6549729.1 GGDEF domain-containing protein [Marinomonas ostreistagni]